MTNTPSHARLLEGKTALITGGTSGIGLATAILYAQQGARVFVCGRSAEGLEMANRVAGVTALSCDVRVEQQRRELFRAIGSRTDHIDTLFLAAGVARFATFENETADSVRDSFGANVEGAYFCVQQALSLMNSGGTVVFCGSVADQVGTPFTSVYSATKAAVRSLTQTLAVELAERNIRVNCLSPGPTATPIHGKYGLDEARLGQLSQMTTARLHMKRMAQPEEIAQAALFLASEQSSFMTGQDLVVDGGLSL